MTKTFQGECLVFFQEGANIIAENIRNLNPFTCRVEGTDCNVRSGYYRKYDGVSYSEEFRQAIDTCVNSCPGGCDLYFTGYSQFGAHAVAAAIDFRQYNPYVVSFGATRAVIRPRCVFGYCYNGCRDFDETRHFLFVNINEAGYDLVPNTFNPFFAVHRGHVLLLDDKTTYTIGYPGLNNDRNRVPAALSAHDEGQYQSRIQRLLLSGCDVIPVAKWNQGHYCHYDDECQSGSCKRKVCT